MATTSTAVFNRLFDTEEAFLGIELSLLDATLANEMVSNPGQIIPSVVLADALGVEKESGLAQVRTFYRRMKESTLAAQFKNLSLLKRGMTGYVYFPEDHDGVITAEMLASSHELLEAHEKTLRSRHMTQVRQLKLDQTENWRIYGPCRQIGIESFRKENGNVPLLVTYIGCSACQVMEECLSDGLSQDTNPTEVKGGLSPAQLKTARASMDGEDAESVLQLIPEQRASNFARAWSAYRNRGL